MPSASTITRSIRNPTARAAVPKAPFDGLIQASSTAWQVRQIMKAARIVCSVPEARKAEAVRDCLEGKISNLKPASILQEHQACFMFLDEDSAALLNVK